ncbi:MAG: hypothetical protein N2Z22_09080, partial [Turneriella sp.]|nr:hypothetical protein [Turneriella sp.]
VNDTATLVVRNTARFHPIPVSNQISLGFGLNLWGASINLDLVQNIQFNARAIVLQLGCWI